jgi:SAM-dependent methyltransferase
MDQPVSSVAFDRAAEYYDQTRGLTPDGIQKTTEVLVGELARRGRVLEVGIGTGQVGLPLHEAGIDLVGLDLAMPMMARLVSKAGDRPPFPLVQADATRMPFADGAFGGAYLRWVLHLIPDWRAATAEIVRVVRPGGVFVAHLGSYPRGPMAEIQERYVEVAGIGLEPEGLDWADWDGLDREMASHGAAARALPTYVIAAREDVETFMRGVEENRFSWTWRVPDDVERRRAAREARRWAEATYGRLADLTTGDHQLAWRAYDLPGGRSG